MVLGFLLRLVSGRMTDENLVHKARSILNPRTLSSYGTEAGGVACALLTRAGHLYTGVCIDVACGIGFCAEHTAIGTMISAGESAIDRIVAVNERGAVIPPCGRCREFMYLIDDTNRDTRVIIDLEESKLLKELLPNHWFSRSYPDLSTLVKQE